MAKPHVMHLWRIVSVGVSIPRAFEINASIHWRPNFSIRVCMEEIGFSLAFFTISVVNSIVVRDNIRVRVAEHKEKAAAQRHQRKTAKVELGGEIIVYAAYIPASVCDSVLLRNIDGRMTVIDQSEGRRPVPVLEEQP